MPLISVVVPVYRNEDTLDVLYERVKAVLAPIVDFELILVEDCGGDRSWEIITGLSKLDPRVKGLQFSRNFGQHYGITAGLDHASGDWVIVMDADLQDRPEEIPRLYEKALEGYDVVLARRVGRKDSFLKRFTSWCFYRVFSYLAEIEYDSSVGNFRIISRRVVESFRGFRERLRFFGGLVDWMGFSTEKIDVRHEARTGGRSSYTFRKLWHLAWDTIIAYSDRPLRFSIKLGFAMAVLSFLYGLYIVYIALYIGVPVLGWSSLMASLYFIGGVIIANLGIIGVYVGKTFDETKKRPLYIVARRAGI
jgi:dolichol-phosphate mannosyltransferase